MDEDKADRLYETVESAEKLRSTLYEEVTATILEDKLKHLPDAHTVTHDHDLRCDFGEKQMDVVLEVGDGEDAVMVIVECKGRGRPMKKDHLASFAFYVEHSDADKGIYVSRSGFQRGAEQIAAACDIQLFEITLLGEPNIKHVEGKITSNPSPYYRHQIGVIHVEDGTPANLSNLTSTFHEKRQLDIRDELGGPTGETLADRLPDESGEDMEAITTTFENGERVRVDGEEYELHYAMSVPQGGDSEDGEGDSFEIDFEDRVDLHLRDVLADQDEYMVFDDIKDQFIDVENGD
ncbi:restriction endonuclease [Natrarchaeobius chitinivorans]|nr:restriction endonuclease [Natrarchaeobius chitinivorans]